MFDLLIQNATIADGTGQRGYAGDIALQRGKILEVSAHIDSHHARQVLDARGLWAAPGFIDIHRHADGAVFRKGFGAAELYQGLTTIVSGNCGMSAAPVLPEKRETVGKSQQAVMGSIPRDIDCTSMHSYLDAVKKQGAPLHSEMLCGLGTLLAQYGGYAPDKKAPSSLYKKPWSRHLMRER